jgi:hypothetical protein
MTETETINFRGVDFEAEFYYQPEEKGDYFYPGCAEAIDEISELKHKGTSFLEILEEYDEEIKDLILEKLKS